MKPDLQALVMMTRTGRSNVPAHATFRNCPNAREFSHKAANYHVSDSYFRIKDHKIGVNRCDRSGTYFGTLVAKQIAEGR